MTIATRASERASEFAPRVKSASIYNEPRGERRYASNPRLPPAEKPLAQSPMTKKKTTTNEAGPGFKVLNVRIFPGRTCCSRVNARICETTRPRSNRETAQWLRRLSSSSSSRSRRSRRPRRGPRRRRRRARRRERVTHWETRAPPSPRVPKRSPSATSASSSREVAPPLSLSFSLALGGAAGGRH